MPITQVNIYRCDGEWCYAAFSEDGSGDVSDTLGIEDSTGEDDAHAEAQEQFPGATVTRVDSLALTEAK